MVVMSSVKWFICNVLSIRKVSAFKTFTLLCCDWLWLCWLFCWCCVVFHGYCVRFLDNEERMQSSYKETVELECYCDIGWRYWFCDATRCAALHCVWLLLPYWLLLSVIVVVVVAAAAVVLVFLFLLCCERLSAVYDT